MPKSLADSFGSGSTKQALNKQNRSELGSQNVSPENSGQSEQQDPAAFLAAYGPDNPEPPQMKDSANSAREDRNALHAAEEYING